MTNETLQMASGDTLATMAIRSHHRVLTDRESAVKHALEVGEILHHLKEHAADWHDWKWWHAERLMWSTARSDFYQWLYRHLPGVSHAAAMEVLAAPNLAQAGWLLSQAEDSDRLQLPEPDDGRLLRVVAGGGNLIIEAIPSDDATGGYWLAAIDHIFSETGRRLQSNAPLNWLAAEKEIGDRLADHAVEDVWLADVPVASAVLALSKEQPAVAD